jgi:prevent-host-death family protein
MSSADKPLHIAVTELRRGYNTYIDMVRNGRTIVITRYGRPIARFEPVERTKAPSQ